MEQSLMKKKIKDLTSKECNKICKNSFKRGRCSTYCPFYTDISSASGYCTLIKGRKNIPNYILEKEVEVDE